jgi:hypothetical protein
LPLAEGAATETATSFKMEISVVGSIHHRARSAPAVECIPQLGGPALKQRLILDTGKPTGYELNIEYSHRQARQQAGVPVHQAVHSFCRRLPVECAVFQFPVSARSAQYHQSAATSAV